jgi:hypothetical protein
MCLTADARRSSSGIKEMREAGNMDDKVAQLILDELFSSLEIL